MDTLLAPALPMTQSIPLYFGLFHASCEFLLTTFTVFVVGYHLIKTQYKLNGIILVASYCITRVLYVSFGLSLVVFVPTGLAMAGYYVLISLYGIYGLFLLVSIILYFVRQQLWKYRLDTEFKLPNIAIIIPVEDEDPDQLIMTIKKALNQEYHGKLTIYCTFDSYEMNAAYLKLLKEYDVEFKMHTHEYGVVDCMVGNTQRNMIICKRYVEDDMTSIQYAISLIEKIDNPEYILFLKSDLRLQLNAIQNFTATFNRYPKRLAMTGTINGSAHHYLNNFSDWLNIPVIDALNGLTVLPVEFTIVSFSAYKTIQPLLICSASDKSLFAEHYNLSQLLARYYGKSSVGLCGLSIAKTHSSHFKKQLMRRSLMTQLLSNYNWLFQPHEISLKWSFLILQYLIHFYTILPVVYFVLIAEDVALAHNLIFAVPLFAQILLVLIYSTRFQMWYNVPYFILYVLFGPIFNLVIVLSSSVLLILCCKYDKLQFQNNTQNDDLSVGDMEEMGQLNGEERDEEYPENGLRLEEYEKRFKMSKESIIQPTWTNRGSIMKPISRKSSELARPRPMGKPFSMGGSELSLREAFVTTSLAQSSRSTSRTLSNNSSFASLTSKRSSTTRQLNNLVAIPKVSMHNLKHEGSKQ